LPIGWLACRSTSAMIWRSSWAVAPRSANAACRAVFCLSVPPRRPSA
jgi:hypothetical protein